MAGMMMDEIPKVEKMAPHKKLQETHGNQSKF
jgi:hypothetical protein